MKVFTKCRELFGITPRYIIADFEAGLFNGLSETLSCSKTFGCFFHFTQAIWRKVQGEGLVKYYKLDEDFKNMVRNVFSAAFLAPEDVFYMFFELKSHFLEHDIPQISDFISYLEKTWFGYYNNESTLNYVHPKFKIAHWYVRKEFYSVFPGVQTLLNAGMVHLTSRAGARHLNIVFSIEKMPTGKNTQSNHLSNF